MEELHTPIERHPTLYFPDGDIVLSASIDGTPLRYQLFRVHKFLLRHHSSTFSNMFADADSAPGETYDGMPIVEMQDDKAEDLAQLLNYLYNPTEMTFKRFDPNTPIVVRGVVRLADKYCINSLRDHLINAVVADWPATLDEWDEFDTEISSARRRWENASMRSWAKGQQQPPNPFCDHIPEPASAIAFAHEFGCAQILPAAYYQLARVPPSLDWENKAECDWLHARWSRLDNRALLHYIRGVHCLSAYYPDTEELLSAECRLPDCSAMIRTPCYMFLERLVNTVWNFRFGLKKDPLRSLLRCLDEGKSAPQFCDNWQLCRNCQLSLPVRVMQLRQRLWDKLPEYFKLTS